jgi:hypothetical protein
MSKWEASTDSLLYCCRHHMRAYTSNLNRYVSWAMLCLKDYKHRPGVLIQSMERKAHSRVHPCGGGRRSKSIFTAHERASAPANLCGRLKRATKGRVCEVGKMRMTWHVIRSSSSPSHGTRAGWWVKRRYGDFPSAVGRRGSCTTGRRSKG